jgi:hypothetical protein
MNKYVQKLKRIRKKIKEMHINSKHANQKIKYNDQTKTKFSPHVCGVAVIVHSHWFKVIGKIGETMIPCLLSVESGNESYHLVFWSLGTLIGLRDRV